MYSGSGTVHTISRGQLADAAAYASPYNAAAVAGQTRVHSRDGSTFLRENDVIAVVLKYDVISEIRLVNRAYLLEGYVTQRETTTAYLAVSL